VVEEKVKAGGENASIWPRSWERGNGCCYHESNRIGCASIWPRSWERGNMHPAPMFPACLWLQFGRVPGNAETFPEPRRQVREDRFNLAAFLGTRKPAGCGRSAPRSTGRFNLAAFLGTRKQVWASGDDSDEDASIWPRSWERGNRYGHPVTILTKMLQFGRVPGNAETRLPRARATASASFNLAAFLGTRKP